MGLSSFLKLRRELLAGASAAVHTLSEHAREADPPLDEQRFWEHVRARKKGLTTRNLQSAVTFCPLLLLPRASKKPCQCGTLVLYCPRFPAISRGYSYVVNHQGSQQGCPTIALWTLTFQGSLFTWVTAGNHLPQILLCSSTPSVREGVGQKAARHPGTQTSTCFDANPPGLCATWKDSPRKTDYIPATSKWSGFAKHSLFSCLEAFLKAWLCNKGASPPHYSQTRRLPIRLRYMFLGPARKPEWLAVSPDEILKKSL